MEKTLEERLWNKVDIRGEDECWPWTGFCRKGYGEIRRGSKKARVHRLAYEFTHGSLDEEEVVRHTCDNPPCCNPKHLRIGTYADNNKDTRERGRHRYGVLIGERGSHAKISEAVALEVRERSKRGESCESIARDPGVNISSSQVRRIATGKQWKHLAAP